MAILGQKLPAAASYGAALGLSLLLLLGAVVGAFWAASEQRTQDAEIRASYQLRSQMRNTLTALQDAETGQRGYLLTGDESYLAPYTGAQQSLAQLLPQLSAFAAREPQLSSDIVRLRDVAVAKMGELSETVALARQGHRERALAIVRTNAGKADMDGARAIVQRVFGTESADLNGHLRAAERGATTLRLIVLVVALMLVAIGLLAVVIVRRGMEELSAARDFAQSANTHLLQEIEHRRATEAKLVQMQRMEAIGQLTGGVAHDFNNMLAVIMSALTLTRRKLERGEADVERFMEAAEDAARRAATLTGRLLAFARRQALNPSVIDVNKFVGGMSELLRRTLGEHIELEAVLAEGLWKVRADVGQLENAIVNVCVNARDAMKMGGKLTIETANSFLDEAYGGANPEASVGEYVMIAITDTGDGMEPEVAARAFEPFYTTKDVGQGTGLGLSHVHGFLKQTGGHVAIYSEPGHGTTIKLYLPRTERPESDGSGVLLAASAPKGDADTQILVVEDDERVRTLTVAVLQELGYAILQAANGADALAILGKNPSIALLFTDIVMPDMSGRVLADQALARNEHLKVLYTTGYTQDAISDNGAPEVGAQLLLKPYSMDDLARKVRSVLDRS